jgi:hypothetical protein
LSSSTKCGDTSESFAASFGFHSASRTDDRVPREWVFFDKDLIKVIEL